MVAVLFRLLGLLPLLPLALYFWDYRGKRVWTAVKAVATFIGLFGLVLPLMARAAPETMMTLALLSPFLLFAVLWLRAGRAPRRQP